MKTRWVLLTVWLVVGSNAHGGAEPDRYLKAATDLVQAINTTNYEAIQSTFSREMAAALPPAQSSAFFRGLTRQLGKLEPPGARRDKPPGVVFHVRGERGAVDLELHLDASNRIAALMFLPLAATQSSGPPPTNRTGLSLPFKGQWLVFWGGDTPAENYHHNDPGQRFAFDIIATGADGKSHRGAGSSNEDYYAFGREILAPADGTVVEVIDGVRDNTPGSLNPLSAVGNCVIIQHRTNEASVLAHFQRGSIMVKAGDTVKRGQVLGKCGNSGNSSEPHLHYHLQNSPVLQDGRGIKCAFEKVVLWKDGKSDARTNYSPVKSNIISPD